ncbi:MAG: CBS domain-containing protein [Gemmatimonadaceae bacterium]
MLRLRDIMTTDVISVAPETSLRNAMALFANRHISGAPVKSGGHVIGVISSTDMMDFVASLPARSASPMTSPSFDGNDDAPGTVDLDEVRTSLAAEVWDQVEELTDLDTHTVADAMSRKVIALAARTPVHVAAARMKEAGVHRVLVMHGGKLLGIVTTKDFVDAIADNRVTTRTFVFPTKSQEVAGAW